MPVRKDRYVLRNGDGYCPLTFDGRQATTKHENGALYMLWLLAHLAQGAYSRRCLAAQVPATRRRKLGITSAVDDASGKVVRLTASALPLKGSHRLNDLEAARRLHKKQKEVQALFADDAATEPEKSEALAEFEAVYEFQKKRAMRSRDNPEKAIRAGRVAITRFHTQLVAGRNDNSQA